MTPDQIMRELARDDVFPKEAMAEAGAQRADMLPIFIDLVIRLSRQRIADMNDGDLMAIIPVFHLLGEWRDPSAFRPLVHMMRLPSKVIEHLLGDAITEAGHRVIASTFDGDLQPIFLAIDDKKADEFARLSLMQALVFIAQRHLDQRPAIEEYFRTFRQRRPKPPVDLLVGWMDAISTLGLEDMSEEVRQAFDQGLIPKEYGNFEHFLADLNATLNDAPSSSRPRDKAPFVTSAIDELSKWHCYSEAFLSRQKSQKVDNVLRVAPWTEIFANTPDKLGRNDPCPCGSGKKFKKCCLH